MAGVEELEQKIKGVDAAIENGDLPKARQIVNQVCVDHPDSYMSFFKLGYVLFLDSDVDGAAQALEKALAIEPEAAEVILMLGSVYFVKKDYDLALKYYLQKADELQIAEVYRTIGNIYHERCQYDDGEKYYRLALRKKPQWTELILDLAQLLLGRVVYLVRIKREWVEEGFRLADVAISHQKQECMGRAYKLKADFFKMTDHPAEAAACYRRSIEYDPNESTTYSNLCTVLLAQGMFAEGMQECHWRWLMDSYDSGNSFAPKDLKMPEWKGEVDPGKTVLVKPEQGLGDQILMLQLFNRIVDMGMEVIYYSEARLKTIIQRSMPRVKVITPQCAGVKEILESADYQVYLLELLEVLNIDPAIAKPPTPYLSSHPILGEQMKKKYEEMFPGQLKVGIAWQSKSSTYGERKTIPLDLWDPIISVPGIQFVSIQYGKIEDDLRESEARTGKSIYRDPEVDPINDLESAVAQMGALDLVVSISNAGAHLAAAMGKPVWLLLSCAPMWHWLHGRTDSIWYPGIEIMRQEYVYSWNPVILKVVERLRLLTDEKRNQNDKSVCGI